MAVLFLPTGPIQEVSLSSGWGDEFVALADRFDAAAARSAAARSTMRELSARRPGGSRRRRPVTRDSFTARSRRRTPARSRRDRRRRGAACARPRARAVLLPGLRRTYCGAHWGTEDVFEDDYFHDRIRGTCPEGHARMLED